MGDRFGRVSGTPARANCGLASPLWPDEMHRIGAGESMTSGPLDKSAGWDIGIPMIAARKPHDLLELSIGYGLILLAVWSPPHWQFFVGLAALCWILLVTGTSFEGWRAMGFGASGALASLWVVGLALLLAAVAAIVADRLHTLHLPGTAVGVVQRYWGYSLWAFMQEFLLLNFVLRHLLRLLPGKKAALMAAGLFALAHLPNPILTLATLLWGFAAGWLFLRYRSIYTLALAHAILGICIATTIPSPVTHHMKVGLGYLTFRPSAHDKSIQCFPAPGGSRAAKLADRLRPGL